MNFSLVRRAITPFQRFFQTEASGGIVLLVVLILAMFWANSYYAEAYHHLWHLPAGIQIGDFAYAQSLHFWINDGLMVLFFLLMGLEIKREVMVGELSSFKRASLPIAAAIGGMAVPAILFTLLNPPGTAGNSGWGIPVATDIAFVVGLLTLFGNSISTSLKVFMVALAIVDDIGAILVIVLFYSSAINWLFVGLALFPILLLALLSRLKIHSLSAYLAIGFVLWLCLLQSGIHTTLAGLLVAAAIPVSPGMNPNTYVKKLENIKQEVVQTVKDATPTEKSYHGTLLTIKNISRNAQSPLQRLEDNLHPLVVYGIVPLFALANAGVTVNLSNLAMDMAHPVTLGIIAGLVLGKPLGIMSACWMAVKLGIAQFPYDTRLIQFLGLGCLAGIGFTMSLFISGLSFQDAGLSQASRIGILSASLLASILGSLILILSVKYRKPKEVTESSLL